MEKAKEVAAKFANFDDAEEVVDDDKKKEVK